MEILQPVRARGERWRVAAIRAYEACQVVTLAGSRHSKRVILPFDDVEPITRVDRPLTVGPRRWRHACCALLAADTPPGGLRCAAGASIDLLPHQIEPALAVLRGAGSRVLLADDVGLGKTIQAGLIVAELIARGAAERVLILTPAGVRDQWSREFERGFAIAVEQADASSLRRLAATLPLGVNPWQTMPLAIASIDYVKRPEVLPAVQAVRWDVVVLDEAHAAAGDSERRDAVRLLAERSPYVILLSATPHSGDQVAFEELCRIGALDRAAFGRSDDGVQDRLLVFRRTRQAIRGDRLRRTHVLRVRTSVTERHMHEALAHYRRAVATEHGDRALALAVLEKRALSSPWSLAQSVDRRLASIVALESSTSPQLALPFGDPDGEATDEDAPPVWPAELALADRREDRRLLTVVAAAARSAALHDDSKLRCLRRLLRRVDESALIFTEYRDTAVHLCSAVGRPALLLHGGMDRRDRSAVVEAFTRTPGTILIATDAAGQGLNLHHHCRFVINIELPWNPMRLEQRIGRVDRIGQTRLVHAVHLIAASSGEIDVLARLKARLARADAAIDAPDPIGIAHRTEPRADHSTALVFIDQRLNAELEVARLTRARAIAAAQRVASPLENVDNERPLLMHVRRRRLRTALAERTLLIYQLTCDDRDGRVVETRLVPLLVTRAQSGDERPLVPSDAIDAWRRQIDTIVTAFQSVRAAREHAIAARIAARPLSLVQPALFDRRVETAHHQALSERSAATEDAEARVAAIERQRGLNDPVARLRLVAEP